MSSATKRPEKVEKFRGKSGVECENFIQNIRDVAFTEGKLQDGLWMANFASLHYSGKALKWHSALPLDVRQDWFKQENALLEHWPPPDSDVDDEVTILPTPAAAPDTAAQIDKCCVTAVLAFSHENQNETFYVADTDRDGDCTLTQDLSLAFRFRWHRDAEPQKRGILECWSGSVHKLLAVECDTKEFRPLAGSRSCARLTVVDPATLLPATSKNGRKTWPSRIDVWNVSLQGLVNPAWPDADGTAATEMITLSRANVCLYFSVNQDVFDRQHRPEHRGHLMFKPLEQELLRG